jgi:hypothetical protein
LESPLKGRFSEKGANPHGDGARARNTSPTGVSRKPPIRDETIRDEKNPSGEGNNTNVVGEEAEGPLVDAGLAEWRDGDASKFLDHDELHELGVLPLGELHRRHERDEL